MSDVNANIGVQIDASAALAELKRLQRQLATFHSSISKSSAAASIAQKSLQTNLLNSINATGKFSASMGTVRSTSDSFTHALETNKLSMREYYRYAGGASKTFGKLFKQEFDTIGKVAESRVKKMQTQYIKMGRDANGAIKTMAITPTSLNMQDYGTKTAMAAQKQAIFNQLMKQGSTGLLNFGKNTQWAGRQLMVGFTIPLAYLGTTAAKVFMDLEAQAIKFKRVYGDIFTTSEETNKALKEVELLAKSFTKYGVAVSKTMEMAAAAAAMGKTGADLMAQVAEATRLSVLGNVEQSQALETTISLTNAFGVSADQLSNKIDFLNAVENQTVVSIEDLTIAVPKAGPVIKQLGGNVEDLAFFLTAMKEGGINASEGANALKSGLASLINPSTKATKMLSSLGVNINAIVEGNSGNIRNTVIDFSRALDTLDPLNRARAIEQLFGKFQFSRLSTLFQNVTKDGTQASRVLDLAGASMEELAILSEREMKTVQDAVGTNFKDAIESLKISLAPVGKAFLQAVTPIVKVIGGLLEKFNHLGDGTKKFIVVATTLVGVVGPVLLMTFGLLANGIANIVKLFLVLRTGFLKVGGNTKILAEQTNYLNTEQLEAATVAASLNQSHTRLTQSFTAETAAVNLLRQAYINATLAAANFARSNPGMMNPGRVGKAGIPPRKFATGATYVPGRGNKDTVPAVLTPGEAVIPKKVAQDPKFQPIIDAMVNGRLQGFEDGTPGAKPSGTNFTHVGGKSTLPLSELMARIEASEGKKSDNYRRAKIFEGLLRAQGKPEIANAYHGLGFTFSDDLNRRLANKEVGIPYADFEQEWKNQGPQKWQNKNIQIASKDAPNFDSALRQKVKDLSSGGKPVTDRLIEAAFNDLPEDIKKSPSYRKAEAYKNKLAEFSVRSGMPTDVKGTENLIRKASAEGYITNKEVKIIELDKIARKPVIDPDKHTIVLRTNSEGKQTISAVYLGDDQGPISMNRLGVGGGKRFPLSARSAEERKALAKVSKDFKSSKLKNIEPADLGRQIGRNIGNSFSPDGVRIGGVGGAFEKPDGSRVFVKPMVSEAAALAEMRGTKIARDVHGLDSPEQKMIVMEDPKTGTKIIGLESPLKGRFTAANMGGRFTERDYFSQLVASSLRGDKDLSASNLSGRRLTDVGTAGVFDKASGNFKFAKSMPSMEEQALLNLGSGGGAKKAFQDSTRKMISTMSPEQYQSRMISEINKSIPKLQKFIKEENLNPKEKIAYNKMLQRLKDGRNADWKSVYSKHVGTLVTKGESLQDDKTEKITKIDSKPKPRNVTSSSNNPADSRIAVVPKGQSVVQTPKLRVAPRLVMKGRADAPEARLTPAQQYAKDNGVSLNAAKRVIAQQNRTQATSTPRSTIAPSKSRMALSPSAAVRMQGVGMAAGMAASGAYISGNAGIGNALMGVSVLASLGPMLASPMGAVVAGLTAVIASSVLLRMAFDKSQNAAMKMAESLGNGNKAIQSFAEFAGKVSAGEVMNKRRANLLNPFAIQTGKTTFGSNFVKGEFGKSLVKDIGSSISTNGKDVTQEQLVNQMTSSVASGAFTADQAKSIVANIGQQIGDYRFSINVNAKLNEIFGPDGQNLLKDPLQIRLNLIEDDTKKIKDKSNILNKNNMLTPTKTQSNIGIAGMAAGGAAIGASIGAAAGVPTGGILSAPLALLGAGVGGVIGASSGFISQKKTQEELGRSSGAQVALQNMALEQSQRMQDSLQIEYEKRIAIAKAAGDAAEAQRLETEYNTSNVKLLEANAKLVKSIQDSYKNAGGAVKGALETGIDKQLTAKYKDTALADVIPMVNDQIKGSALNKEQQYTIKTQMVSGNISPLRVMDFIDTFGKDKKTLSKIMTLITKFGGAQADQILQIAELFKNKTQKIKFIANISTMTTADADKYLKMFALASQVGQVLPIDLVLNFYNNNPTEAAAFQETIDKINALKGKISLEVAARVLGEKEMAALKTGQEYFASLPPEQQKTYLQVLRTFVDVVGNNTEAFLNWQKTAPPDRNTIADYAAAGAEQVTKAEALANTNSDPKKSGEIKSRNTTLDDLLKKLKLTRDASINAQLGVKELSRVFKKAGGDIKVFTGLNQALLKLGADTGFIDFIGGMDNATEKGYVNAKKLKKGIVELTSTGKLALKGYQEAVIGAFSSSTATAIMQLQKQRVSFDRLKVAGASSAEALELVSDANFAVGLSSAKTSKELKILIEDFKKLKKEQNKTDLAIDPEKAFQDAMNNAERRFTAEEAGYQLVADKAIKSAQIKIDANQKEIDSRGHLLKTSKEYGDELISSIDDEVAAKERLVAVGADGAGGLPGIGESLARLGEESDKLSEYQIAMNHQVGLINDKYDEQEKSLNKISDINAEIANQQRQQLGLADALSRGDISAAAAAAQDMRSSQSASGSKNTLEALSQARQNAINGVTASNGMNQKQITDRQYAIDREAFALNQSKLLIEKEIEVLREKLYQIELLRKPIIAEIFKYELDNYTINKNEIQVAEDLLKKQTTDLDAKRLAWKEASVAYELALTKTEDFNTKLTAGQIILKSITDLWNGLTDKTITITTVTANQIDRVIAKPDTNLGRGGDGRYDAANAEKQAKLLGSSSAKIQELVKSGYTNLAESSTVKMMKDLSAIAPLTSEQIVSARKRALGYLSDGGVVPKYFANGGYAKGSDTVPAMLTPGEFVMSKYAVEKYGVENMKSINSGSSVGDSVYNYNLNLNVKSDAKPDDIARAVMVQIKSIDAQRIRGARF